MTRRTLLLTRAVALQAAAVCLAISAASAQQGSFTGLAGLWSGNGTIELEDNARERIRCRATYAVRGDGEAMNLSLRCASDSYKFEIKSDVVSKGGAITGSWSEATRGVNGPVDGKASRNRFHVNVNSPAFTARLEMATEGAKQTATITSDSALKIARISLTRG